MFRTMAVNLREQSWYYYVVTYADPLLGYYRLIQEPALGNVSGTVCSAARSKSVFVRSNAPDPVFL